MTAMQNPPLKRDISLQPFSRDHYVGLVQAQRLVRAASRDQLARRQALETFQAAWRDEIAAHFDDEERLLLELIPRPADRQRLLEEHARLRAMAGEVAAHLDGHDPAWVRTLGELLNDHIRWEERALFVSIENAASTQQLSCLASETAAVEAARPRSHCRNKSSHWTEKESSCS